MVQLNIVRRLPGPLRRALVGGADRLRETLERRVSASQHLTPAGLEAARQARADEERLTAARRRPRRHYVGRRVAIAGLFSTRCGLQRGAELMRLDLQARGVETLALDLSSRFRLPSNVATEATAELSALDVWAPSDLIIHLNPPDYLHAVCLFPPEILAAVTKVAYWAWELNVVADPWRASAETADEIWTPSPFVAETIAAGIPGYDGTIRIVPHAVDRAPPRRLGAAEKEQARLRLGIPVGAFVVGSSFSFNSNYARKNPCAVIDAFRAGFPERQDGRQDGGRQDVRLVIRCNDVAHHERLFSHLVSFAGDDSRIMIWNTDQVACPMHEFYGLLQVYASLHRGEGYGLNLAEAAQAGVPVLTTGWGLAPDIAARPQLSTVGSRLIVPLDPQHTYDAYPGALWAEPDVLEAASRLQALHAEWRTSRSVAAA